MRLSDIKGERTLDVIADIIEPIANIAADDNASALFRREKLPDGETPQSFILKRVKKAAPALLRKHKADVITILSSIEGVSPKAYMGSLNLVKLTRDFIELMTDEAFGELFISAQSGVSSGSAPETTEAH